MIDGVISRVTIIVTHILGRKTPLITTLNLKPSTLYRTLKKNPITPLITTLNPKP